MKVNVTACWHGVRFLSKTSYQTRTSNFCLQLTRLKNNIVRPHQTAVRTLSHLCKSTTISFKLVSDVDRMQWKRGVESRERTKSVIVITKERWGKHTTPETEGRLDKWNWAKDLRRLLMRVRGCRVVVLSPLLTSQIFFLSLFIPTSLPSSAPSRKIHPLHILTSYPDRNIAYAESALIASSTSWHLATPSPLKKWLSFIIFHLSNSCCVTLLSTLFNFFQYFTKLFYITV